MSVKTKNLIEHVYIDNRTGKAIIAKANPNDSYTFYSANLINDNTSSIDTSSLKPIDDIIDYIEQNNLDINILSKKKTSIGGKVNGK